MRKIALVLAGGQAPRLWPRSTEKNPKQFIHLVGEGTMIQNTVFRLMPLFQPEDIYIITPESLSEIAKIQLPTIPAENFILEPFGRNTAPCLALAAAHLSSKLSDDTIMMIFPSDHVIFNVREFHQSLETAADVAYEKKGIVTIGIQPKRAETAFGYIQIDDSERDLGDFYNNGVRYSTAFAEKPDVNTARRFIDSGDFLWNSGIFIWRTDTFWEAYEKYLPDLCHLFKMLDKHVGTDTYDGVLNYIYMQIESQSVDYAILEKADNVFVIKTTFKWSDLGSWDEHYRLALKDARNNFIEGDVISLNTSNCLVLGDKKLIGLAGIDNLLIIDSEDALLICKRGCSSDVNEILDYMKRKNINRY